LISLVEINEENYREVCSLKVFDEQKGFVAPAVSILARAYAKRGLGAEALAIANGDVIVGVVMYLGFSCYAIEQFLIDHRYQNQGFGKQALALVMDKLRHELKYDTVEICVKKEAAQALSMYKAYGFYDTGHDGPDEPDSYCLRYDFPK